MLGGRERTPFLFPERLGGPSQPRQPWPQVAEFEAGEATVYLQISEWKYKPIAEVTTMASIDQLPDEVLNSLLEMSDGRRGCAARDGSLGHPGAD